jgi:hypothetical protein
MGINKRSNSHHVKEIKDKPGSTYTRLQGFFKCSCGTKQMWVLAVLSVSWSWELNNTAQLITTEIKP